MSEQPARRPGDEDFEARFADIVSNWDTDQPIVRPDVTGEGDGARSPVDPTQYTGPSDNPSAATQQPIEAAPVPPKPVDADTSGAIAADPPDPSRSAPNGDGPRSTDPRSVFGTAPSDSGWRVHVPPEEPDEDFVPAPVAPLPRGDLSFWGALVGLIAGPLWLIYLVVFHRDDGHFPMLLAIALTVGGFGLMVWRLPARRPEDDDSDDGAVL